MTDQLLAGQVAFVTGGAGGLGRAIGVRLLSAGCAVILADIDGEAAVDAAAELSAMHAGRSFGVALDVADEAAWERALDDVVGVHGRLDILVNNAGIYRPNVPFEDMSFALWRQHQSINSDGTFLGCKQAILRMKGQGGGAIVNIASGMAVKANPNGVAYCASKAAALMTTRCAAAAAGKYGIRVNAVLPGAVDTPMLRGNAQEGEDADAYVASMAGYSALGYLAGPADIAEGVFYLASPAARAVTGVALPVDGGNI